jgi:hypothetical protein
VVELGLTSKCLRNLATIILICEIITMHTIHPGLFNCTKTEKSEAPPQFGRIPVCTAIRSKQTNTYLKFLT